MAYLVFLNLKEDGTTIDDCLCGDRVIPEKGYDHFFFLPEEVDIETKKVVDGELVDK